MKLINIITRLFKKPVDSDLTPRGKRSTCKLGVYIPMTKNFIGGPLK